MTSAAGEVVRALLDCTAIGKKRRRKMLVQMHWYLRSRIPENGVGPQISARREAAQLLASALREDLA